MNITIASVGRLKSGAESQLYERYLKLSNLSHKKIKIGPTKLIEVTECRSSNKLDRLNQEAKSLLSKINSNVLMITLEERGKILTSQEFSEKLLDYRDSGVSELVFVIGGPDGIGQEIIKKAQFSLSLGKMTFPHGLVRVLLTEQLYRSITIITGHPYHRD